MVVNGLREWTYQKMDVSVGVNGCRGQWDALDVVHSCFAMRQGVEFTIQVSND